MARTEEYQNPYYMVPQHRPRAWVNNTLIILNVMYFLYLELTGSTEDAYHMLDHGAMYGPYILKNHEYYRLLTSMFMHFGINHIVNNMLVLFVLGDNLERALGKVKYLLFYLICGIGANAVSLLLEMPTGDWAVGAGASGAIFGVVGGLIYVVAVNKGRLEDLNTRQLVIMAAFSLYLGFTGTGVDNTAHIAGLIIGIILAALLYRNPKPPCRKYF